MQTIEPFDAADTYVPAAAHRKSARPRHQEDDLLVNGRTLLMARRHRQLQMFLAGAAALVLFLAAFTIFFGVKQVMAKWHSEPRAMQADTGSAGPQPTAPVVALPEIPPQEPRLTRFLLLGSDQRGDDPGYRTDVIVLVTVDTANYTASAVSFPRDLWVEPPTLYPMKINMVQALGGFDAMAAMFEANFGVRPDFYVLTNFTGFTSLIDSLGGIDVHVHQPLKDSCDLPQVTSGVCDLEPGVQPMDGATALWYVRSRSSTSDFDRLRRAQEVVQAVFERMINLNALANVPGYYEALSQNLETNISLGDIGPLVPVAARLFNEPSRIHTASVTEEQASPSWSWEGMWILLPDYEAIEQLMEETGMR